MSPSSLAPAAQAFDAVADRFDERFGGWLSVAAQRRAVRSVLASIFPEGARVLELGGGTGDDALWLMQHGRVVQLTDPSPTMVRLAEAKLAGVDAPAPQVAMAEDLGALTTPGQFDGAFSNFAGLNCVVDLTPVARGLARLIRPGGRAALVVFGTFSPGEWVVELLRGRPKSAVRRFSRGDVPARLGGRQFTVRYHRSADVARAFAPHFHLVARHGIGVFVPPSAAEPWISGHPRLLGVLEQLDAVLARPLAPLGDHVLYELERTNASVEEPGT